MLKTQANGCMLIMLIDRKGMPMKPILTLMVLVLVASLSLVSCEANPKPIEDGHLIPSALQDFTDGFFPGQLEELDIPGIVIVMVEGEQVTLARGYGVASLEQGTPMDPDTTLMAIGSVSKLFVATAVMQLVERGQLDLHADVNQYLTTFQLPETHPEPVTLAHLLSHTSGIEDPPYVRNPDPSKVRPLGEYLSSDLPLRAHPVGEVFLYSSTGYDLAAFIVEQVAGIPFSQYVEDNIFKPLGMQQTRYVPPSPLPANMATGYFYEKGGFLRSGKQIPQPLDYNDGYPSGAVISSAGDMAHFISALLQGGCHFGTCILEAQSLELMMQPQSETGRENQQQTLGFVMDRLDGELLLGHSGAIRGFGSLLHILPERNIGFFLSFNEECWGTSACEILQNFRLEFLERLTR